LKISIVISSLIVPALLKNFIQPVPSSDVSIGAGSVGGTAVVGAIVTVFVGVIVGVAEFVGVFVGVEVLVENHFHCSSILRHFPEYLILIVEGSCQLGMLEIWNAIIKIDARIYRP
jgi:hypothetical protein